MDTVSKRNHANPLAAPAAKRQAPGSPLEVLRIFLKLGLTSFGGPIAHLGYFREEFVVRRSWLDEQSFVDLVALCQFLPGPASSQVGFSIGLMRAGYLGALAAWTGFTLPSAAALVLFAYGAGGLSGPIGTGLLHGLKLVAVAIVAQAVWGMALTLCPDRERASIALASALIILFNTSSIAQIGSIVLGGIAGLWLCRGAPLAAVGHILLPVSRTAGFVALTVFFVLLVGLPLLSTLGIAPELAVFDAFYRSGALVFGGGHVVLPLLREAFVTPGWVSDNTFLAGYGVAQAVPGPLFTFAAFLGTVIGPSPHGIVGAVLGLIGIFLPGILVLLGTLPFWDAFRNRAGAQAMMRGVNAAVVGLLGAALYNPVWTTSVKTTGDFGIALVGFVLLMVWRIPPLFVVLMCALGGALLSTIGSYGYNSNSEANKRCVAPRKPTCPFLEREDQMTIENLDAMLQKAFDESTKIYQQRGFQRRIGFGRKPGLVSVDLANAWTLPGNPFTCDRIDEEIIPGMQRLLAACRTNGHVVVHVTTAYQITDRDDPKSDMGLWHHKVPVESVNIKDEHLWAIDTRIAPIEGEYVMLKKRASAFSGTPLAGYLRSAGVDTILVTGVTATACVRTTICDGLAEGFRTIAVRECIGDRVPGAVAWNLFDIDAKFADVESVDTCVNYLNNVDGFNQKARLSG